MNQNICFESPSFDEHDIAIYKTKTTDGNLSSIHFVFKYFDSMFALDVDLEYLDEEISK